MAQKADAASAITVALSGFAMWLDRTNGWVAEHMPLITAFGIVGGFLLTAWYYWQAINQRKRDRALEHKRMDHEVYLEKLRHGNNDE